MLVKTGAKVGNLIEAIYFHKLAGLLFANWHLQIQDQNKKDATISDLPDILAYYPPLLF